MATALPIPYAKLLALRAARPATEIHTESVVEDGQVAGYKLAVECGSVVRTSWIDPSFPEWNDFLARVLPLCDAPIEQKEVRFYTHDWANPWTWNGKTCGDPAAHAVGGAAVHPLTGLWVDATGAGLLAAYAANPTDPTPLYQALGCAIAATYDDVSYRWLDAQGQLVAWLDLPTDPTEADPGVWKDAQGAVITSYDPADRKWKDAQGNDRTSSRWRIDPYDDKLIRLLEVGLDAELRAKLPAGKAFRWLGYGLPVGAQKARLEQYGLPTDVAYKGVEYAYYTIRDLRFGCNDYTQYGQPEDGNPTITQAMVYNYTRTVEPILDARQKQRLDLVMDDHAAILDTGLARGTFLAVQYPSI